MATVSSDSEAPAVESPAKTWESPAYGWYLTVLLALAYFVSYLDRSVITLLVEPIKASLALSDTQMSLLLGLAFALFYAIGGIPLGYLADRRNRKAIAVASILGWSAMTAFCGVTKSYWAMFLGRVGVGIGEAGLSPAAMSMISDCFAPKRRHFPLATFIVGGTFGGGLAVVIGAGLLHVGERLAHTPVPFFGLLEPWQWVFVLVSLPGVPVALAIATLREPARKGVLSAASTADQHRVEKEYLRKHWRCLVGLYSGASLVMMVNVSYLIWGPTLLVRVHGMDIQRAGITFGLPVFAAGLIGTYLAPAIARWVTERGRTDGTVRAVMWIAAIVMLPMAIGPLLPGPVAMIATIVPAIGLMIGIGPIVMIGTQLVLPNQLRARAVAFYSLILNLVAFGLGPLVVGLLTDYVFRNEKLIHYSTAMMTILGIPIALVILGWTCKHYRSAVADAQLWNA